MAIGNTFGATSFCSYGAYWITFSLISTFDTADATKNIADSVCRNETLMGLFMLVSHSHQIQARANLPHGGGYLLIALYVGLVHFHYTDARVHAEI
jgi:hypothetical protein